MEKEKRGKPVVKHTIIFILIHLLPLLLIWTGATWFDWAICIFLYFFRMFFVTGGYHRYFAHKTFQTSRIFQFILAFFAQTSMQKGALWWAANHRIHHKYSDKVEDPHSNKRYGFWYSHLGWILGPDYKVTRYDLIRDYAKYPELVWLNKNHLFPPAILAISLFLAGIFLKDGSQTPIIAGLSTVLAGFFLSTILLYHGTFSVNSLMHTIGKQRYESGDESKNSWLLAIITMGEGWHNNHHFYQSTARQGFFWWEFDPTYYILRFLSWFGLVWDLRPVPSYIKHAKSMSHAMELKQAGK